MNDPTVSICAICNTILPYWWLPGSRTLRCAQILLLWMLRTWDSD